MEIRPPFKPGPWRHSQTKLTRNSSNWVTKATLVARTTRVWLSHSVTRKTTTQSFIRLYLDQWNPNCDANHKPSFNLTVATCQPWISWKP